MGPGRHSTVQGQAEEGSQQRRLSEGEKNQATVTPKLREDAAVQKHPLCPEWLCGAVTESGVTLANLDGEVEAEGNAKGGEEVMKSGHSRSQAMKWGRNTGRAGSPCVTHTHHHTVEASVLTHELPHVSVEQLMTW